MDDAGLSARVAALEAGLAVVDPIDVPLFSVAGSDHRETLQRVLTQDVLGLEPGEGRLALLLAPKGQFRAMMAIFARESGMLLAAPSGRGGELAALLGTYLALSRSRLEPVASRAVAIVGPAWPDAARAAGAAVAPLEAGGWTGGGAGPLWLAGRLLGSPGAVAVAETDEGLAPLRAVLESLGAVTVGADAIELARIRAGWPAWGSELTGTVLPPEAGIGDEAVSHAKGCYVGQETMARLRTYGHLNRRLVGVLQQGGPATRPELPAPLRLGGDERPVGELTSWGRHPERGGVGLALLRSKAVADAATLTAAGRTYRVAGLPLW